jgi:adenylosuccinate synthase
MLETTLCLLKRDNKILLAKKKRGFGEGKYNGVGGKIKSGETPLDAMLRETKEEILVTPTNYEKVGIIQFDEFYKEQKERVVMHVFVATKWDGEPAESDETKPEWFDIRNIPYDRMFPDDTYWLPYILDGKKIRAYFEFDENWNMLNKKIEDLNKNISIVIDGQAGSCGKGKISGYLALKDNFNVSTNNWSSNAGHTYVQDDGRKIVVSHLPMAIVNPNTKLCINAGAIITPEILYKEIDLYKDLIGDRKIYIHPRAMIIQEKHREIEKENIRSGSTFKGCGAALADKIMRKKGIVLAKEYFENIDRQYKNIIEVSDTANILNKETDSILIEGAQGQDLDINYGLDYPNVTSRMCSAAQLVADAGLSVFDVKDIYMIIRPYPIRISNETNIGENIYSGDYAGSKEISWDEIAKRCGYEGHLEEYTTVTKKKRRVFEMNWERLKYNVMINKPTQIVLNFAQYIDYKAYKCKSYEELPQKVKDFISKIEEETKVPVTIIGTGEKNEDIIDLRR